MESIRVLGGWEDMDSVHVYAQATDEERERHGAAADEVFGKYFKGKDEQPTRFHVVK